MTPFSLLEYIGQYSNNSPILPYLILFAFFVIASFGAPILEEIILITGAFMAKNGLLNIYIFGIVSLFGLLIADSIIYLWGKLFFIKLCKIPIFNKIFPRSKIDLLYNKFSKHGVKYLFFGRFIATIRAPIILFCGITNIPYSKFILYDGLCSVITVTFWLTLTYLILKSYESVLYVAQKYSTISLLILILCLIILIIKFFPKNKKA